MNGLLGEKIRKELKQDYICKSEYCMKTENDERALENWRLSNREYIVKLKQYDDLECETDLKNTMPAHLGSFILSKSKKISKNFILEIDGLKTINVYKSDTDSFYIEEKYWDVLDRATLVGKNLSQGKNDYKKVVFLRVVSCT